jgi:centromere protein C
VLTRPFTARKTGVFLKDTGARDEHGMQPLDDIFSSPEKDSRNGAEDDDEEESDEEPMDIDESEPFPSAATGLLSRTVVRDTTR